MAEVLIAGGGVMGCSTAISLLREQPGLDVTVVEPDPSYSQAASPAASGGVRQLFSCPENILLSRATLEVIHDWRTFAATGGGDPPELGWKRNGYLFIVGPAGTDDLAANLEVQQRLGVQASWLDRPDIEDRFPALRTDDLAAAVFSPEDGWLDPHAFLVGLRNKARDLGAHFLTDEVVDFSLREGGVSAVELGSGRRVPVDVVVNTAGTWAPELAKRVGMYVPVEPMRRFEHYVDVPIDLAHLPFIKDLSHLAIRPEGPGLSVGLVDRDAPGGFDLTTDPSYFDEHVWPALAHRIPALDRLRLRSTWAGLYDENRLDRNMIIGNWPGRLDNVFIACGFSGHGLMHAPAVGRALAELIVHGEYRTIDLHRFGYRRVLENEPYPERGII